VAHNDTIRQGTIFWLDDCPPLDGGKPKRRPVIVVSTREMLARGGPVVVVATSHTVLPSEPDLVKIPNRQDNRFTTSRLPKRCWAVPRWFLLIEPEKLTQWAGYITGDVLRQLMAAVEHRKDEMRKTQTGGT
jgi:mRNA-degrading endonuclease toxin of MazEF toxin-antitoxin module